MRERPAWIGRARDGTVRHEAGLYLDPGAPGVIDYTAAVAADLLSRYDVDGLHLDYIRYPGQDWGYNEAALRRFRRLYGADTGAPPAPDDPEFCHFRRHQVTDLVRRLHAVTRSIRPRAVLSVAVVAQGPPDEDFRRTLTYGRYFQDWPAWVREGIVDAVYLMNYKRADEPAQQGEFEGWVRLAAPLARGRQIVVGQGAFLQGADASLRQLRWLAHSTGLHGVAVYSYAAPADSERQRPAFWKVLGEQVFRKEAPVPALPWIERPETGALVGRVTDRSGHTADAAIVTVNGPTRRRGRTDAGGFYVFTGLPPGRYSLRATVSRGEWVDGLAQTLAGRVIRRDLDLKESDRY